MEGKYKIVEENFNSGLALIDKNVTGQILTETQIIK